MGDDIYVIAQSGNKFLLYFHDYMIFERTTVSINEVSNNMYLYFLNKG